MDKYYVNPPCNCDVCSAPITTEFSDALLPRFGQWANVCPTCAVVRGVTYGTGRGQRYRRVETKAGKLAYLKVEG